MLATATGRNRIRGRTGTACARIALTGAIQNVSGGEGEAR